MARLRKAVEDATGRTWSALPHYDEPDVELWLSRVVPLVQAGQRQSVAITDLYLARALERQPIGVNAQDILAATRNGVTADEVYRRPFVEVWTALKGGQLWKDAVALGLERATSAAAMDVQLAMRDTSAQILGNDPNVIGFQRVPDGGACDFCLVASEQMYHSEDLSPLHNRCGCGVEPVTRDQTRESTGLGGPKIDPESRITAPEINKDLTVAIEQHGELGPVLVDAADSFKSL